MSQKLVNFNSNINTIGSIPNYDIFHLAFKTAQSGSFEELEKALISNNEFNFRTEGARGRFFRGIRSNLLRFENSNQRELVRKLFEANGLEATKRFVIFWQMSLNNDLFYFITKELFLKLYFSGRTYFPVEEIEAYIGHLQEENEDLKKWSPKTVRSLCSKYLTILKKIEFLTGSKKKEVKHIQADSNTFIFFIYYIHSAFPETVNIYDSKLFEFLFMSKESFSERAKKIDNLKYYDFSYNGVELQLTPKLQPQELINVLSN